MSLFLLLVFSCLGIMSLYILLFIVAAVVFIAIVVFIYFIKLHSYTKNACC